MFTLGFEKMANAEGIGQKVMSHLKNKTWTGAQAIGGVAGGMAGGYMLKGDVDKAKKKQG